jgi:NADH dehydrogenase
MWIVIHIWYLMGFRNRVAVMLNWCWNYLTYRQGARLITGGSPSRELEALAARAELGTEKGPSGEPKAIADAGGGAGAAAALPRQSRSTA